jgi:hypothetical protein
MRAMPWLAGGFGALLLLALAIALAGSVVVRDRTGEVARAIVTNDRETQPLLRLPGGLFVAIPLMEGTIEIECRDGSRHRNGYVTGHMHIRVRVEGRCGRMVEVR